MLRLAPNLLPVLSSEDAPRHPFLPFLPFLRFLSPGPSCSALPSLAVGEYCERELYTLYADPETPSERGGDQ